jgi:hypothetical protein
MAKKLGLGLVIVAVLALAWFRVPRVRSSAQKQNELIEKASVYVTDKAYVTAIDLLEQAVSYSTDRTGEAEEMLKKAYIGASDYDRQYTALLAKQMKVPGATADVFREAADYYISDNKLKNALDALKNGVEKTGDADLTAMYEKERYAYTVSQTSFEDVTDFLGSYIQVRRDGYWGVANKSGKLLLPCVYEKVSTYSAGKAVVLSDGEIYAVNNANKRTALLKPTDALKDGATDFGNLSQNRVAVRLPNGKWKRATADFAAGSAEFDEIGTYSDNYAAVKAGGKWGVIDLAGEYLIPAEHDEIILDPLGRCYGQGTVFVKDGGVVHLYVSGKIVEGKSFDDARPFGEDGPAAVKTGDKWGFIDTDGNFELAPAYEDALSFGGHVAAVKQGELWGYLALTGNFGIEPQFSQARSFVAGSAPVLTEEGWQIISLIEYAKEAGLF